MKRVYIAGPITKGRLHDNVNQSTAAFISLAKAGYAPLNPMWSVYAKQCDWRYGSENEVICVGTVNGSTEMSHAEWIGLDLPWIEVAHAILRLPGESTGADREVAHAKAHGIPVFFSLTELLAGLPA